MSDLYPTVVPEGETAPQPAAPNYTLFDAASVTIATLLGAPLAGGILMAVNYRRLGKETAAAAAFLAGLAITIAAIVSGNVAPSGVLYSIPVILLVAMRGIAHGLQGSAVREHVSQGGKLGSRWIAFSLGIGSMVMIFGGVFVLVVIQQVVKNTTSKVAIGSNDAIFISGLATREEAGSLGDSLKKIGYFTDRGVTVLLSKEKSGSVVTFVVNDGTWDNPQMVSAFEVIGIRVAPAVGGFPIQVGLADTERAIKKQMAVGKVTIGSKDDVYYLGAATESDAKALGQALKVAGYLGDRGVGVLLEKGDATIVSFVVREGSWNNSATVAAFEQLVRQSASAVGGLPVKLHFLDSSLETRKELMVQ